MREGNGHSDSVRKEHREKRLSDPVVEDITSGKNGWSFSGRSLAASAFLLLTGLAAGCSSTRYFDPNENTNDASKKEDKISNGSSDTNVNVDATLEVSYDNQAPDAVGGTETGADVVQGPESAEGEADVPTPVDTPAEAGQEDTGVDTPIIIPTDAQDSGETDGSDAGADGCNGFFGYCFDIPVPVDVVGSEAGADEGVVPIDAQDGGDGYVLEIPIIGPVDVPVPVDAGVDTPIVLTDVQETGVDQGTPQPDVSTDPDSVLTDQVVLLDVPIILVDAQDGGETDGSTPVDSQEAGTVPVDTGVDIPVVPLTDVQETGVDQGTPQPDVQTGLDTPKEVAPDVQPEVDTPQWWDPWTDCTTVTIVGKFPDGFSHKITLDLSKIDLSLFSPDGSDIRVYEGDCEGGPTGGVLNHWIENWNQNKGVVWVKTNTPNVPSIAMVYGNVDAPDVSNISTTFLFGDDFSGTELDTSKWTLHNWIGSLKQLYLKDGYLIVEASWIGMHSLESTLNSSSSQSMVIEMKFKHLQDELHSVGTIVHSSFTSYKDQHVLTFQSNHPAQKRHVLADGANGATIDDTPFVADIDHPYKLVHWWVGENHSGQFYDYLTDTLIAPLNGNYGGSTTGKIGMQMDTTYNAVDWFFVRNYTPEELVYLY